VLGTQVLAIKETEDRDLFVRKLDEINVKTAHSQAVNSLDEALSAAKIIGYPLIVRAAYALGGWEAALPTTITSLQTLCNNAFSYSPQVLIEESLKGWKEIEYEVVRDQYDNCITVCNMENFDPLGIHTGESIVVAPSQTLSNRVPYCSDSWLSILSPYRGGG
jgi:carbamoyl-phosphate synthase large subunit